MSFPKNYTKDQFKYDIEHKTTFNFKAKLWIQVIVGLMALFMILIGGLFLIMLTLIMPTMGILMGAIFIIGGLGGVSGWFIFMTRKIEITPEGISWKAVSSGYIKFLDIDDMSFYPSWFFNLHTVKIFDTQHRSHKIRTSMMTTPRKWYSEEMIRSVLDNYWRKANPNAKYSTKMVSSVPSESGKKISLLKSKKSQQQGYKCPKCLVVHEEKIDFCPKCGTSME